MSVALLSLVALSAGMAVVGQPADFQSGGFANAPAGALDIAHVPAPIFRDPIYDGAADPTVVWNGKEKAWYILYTQRRANQQTPGVSWCYGSKIGIAKSTDAGRSWDYVGVCKGLDRGLQAETFWAPHVFEANGKFHMFVVYIPKIPFMNWGGKGRISHYTSKDLENWKFDGDVDVKSDNVIDPGVVQLRDGRWLMVFRDDNAGVRTAKITSTDLKTWTRLPSVTGDRTHEAPVILFWKDKYWLFVDEWHGLGVYESDNGIDYKYNNLILDKPGKRSDDGFFGGHPGVARAGDKAFVFYHVHADRKVSGPNPPEDSLAFKRTSLQIAELELVDGKLTCNRDKYAK